MSEEKAGFFAQLKTQIIAGATVALTTAGTVFMDEMKVALGLQDPEAEPQTEVVQQPQQPNITINIPEQKKDTVVKVVKQKAPVKKTETEKRKEEGFDW